MNAENTVRELVQDYLEKYQLAVKKANPAASLFGIGMGPKNDPCHTVFLERLEAYTSSLTDISPEDAKSVVLAIPILLAKG